MFKRKKKKTGCQTPEYRCPTIPPPIPEPPKPKDFENAQNMLIIPRRDTIAVWEDNETIPFKDEILIAYDDITVIYKKGDGIHKWRELPEKSLAEVLSNGLVCYNGGINQRYKIRFQFFPKRTM